MKTLEEFDFTRAPQIPAAKIRELAEGGYIERIEPGVLIGECGTGKSYLATGLARTNPDRMGQTIPTRGGPN
jgi:DNA replication protein DnaC